MKSKPLLVGVTGGIGSGKTTICKVFQVLGVPVYNSDNRAKFLLNSDEALKEAVVEQFGVNSYRGNSLDKEFMAQTVFSDKQKLEALNSLVHPAVGRDFEAWVQSHLNNSYLIKEAALLFETKSYRSLDFTVLVTAPERTRIERVLARDLNRSEQQIADIMARQLPDAEKERLANFVLDNDNRELLLPQVLKLNEFFRSAATKKSQQEV